MNDNSNINQSELDAGMAELEKMFGTSSSDIEGIEKVTLSQSLEGFASCFPDWDLHPPVQH